MPGPVTGAGCQGHQRVVHDEGALPRADATHDAVHDRRIVRPVHAGDAEADRVGHEIAARERLLHHAVEDLFHFQLALGLEIGARPACRREHAAVCVGEQADGLRASSVESEYMHRHGVSGPRRR
jgi:hypothetical protein